MQVTKIAATWKLLASEPALQRSSHALSVMGRQAFIFSGELKPREPRDNDVHTVDLTGQPPVKTVTTSTSDGPSARVGAASATIGESFYVFSGRGGLEMTPIEEAGTLWSFSRPTSAWTCISPNDPTAPYPEARSYHCMTSDNEDNIFVHAGCPKSGRLSDLWSFSIRSRSWKRLASAPDPTRGSTSIAYSDGRIYRMGGFDGKEELGGQIDIYDVESNSWESLVFQHGPENRSVSTLLALNVNGRKSLITMFGERNPSALGHQGAGKMLADVWVWDIETETWSELQTSFEPAARGWFAADILHKEDGDRVVLQGGLGEANERLGDLWLLDLGPA